MKEENRREREETRNKKQDLIKKRLAPVSLSYHVQACMRDTEDETQKNC